MSNGIGLTLQPCLREKLFKKFKNLSYKIINVIHPSVVFAADVRLGKGVRIMAQEVVVCGNACVET